MKFLLSCQIHSSKSGERLTGLTAAVVDLLGEMVVSEVAVSVLDSLLGPGSTFAFLTLS